MKKIKAKLPDANRVAIYAVAVGDILAALLVIATDLSADGVVATLTAVVAVNAKLLMFLRGWQQMEDATYKARLIENQRVAALEVQAAEADLVAQASAPRAGLRLPR